MGPLVLAFVAFGCEEDVDGLVRVGGGADAEPVRDIGPGSDQGPSGAEPDMGSAEDAGFPRDRGVVDLGDGSPSRLRVGILGLPGSLVGPLPELLGDVLIDGQDFRTRVRRTTELELRPGFYRVSAAPVGCDEATWRPTPSALVVEVPPRSEASVELLYAPDPVRVGLAAAWPLDGSGQDAGPNGHDGTVVGAQAAADRDGRPGRALTFDGSNDRVELGDVLNRLALPITIALWLRLEGTASIVYPILFLDDPAAPPGIYSGLWVQVSAGGLVEASFGNGGAPGGASRRSAVSERPVPRSAWSHVVVAVTDKDTFDIHVDGEPGGATLSGTAETMLRTGNAARIGFSNTGATRAFEGALDDIVIYGRSLSACELEAVRRAPIGSP